MFLKESLSVVQKPGETNIKVKQREALTAE